MWRETPTACYIWRETYLSENPHNICIHMYLLQWDGWGYENILDVLVSVFCNSRQNWTHTHSHTGNTQKNMQPHSFLNSWKDAEAPLARQLPFPMRMGWYTAFCGYSLAVFWRRAALFWGNDISSIFDTNSHSRFLIRKWHLWCFALGSRVQSAVWSVTLLFICWTSGSLTKIPVAVLAIFPMTWWS